MFVFETKILGYAYSQFKCVNVRNKRNKKFLLKISSLFSVHEGALETIRDQLKVKINVKICFKFIYMQICFFFFFIKADKNSKQIKVERVDEASCMRAIDQVKEEFLLINFQQYNSQKFSQLLFLLY